MASTTPPPPADYGKPNWANRTLWTGDNLDILRGMNSASVDLIYLDPPFNSNQDYAAPVGSKAAGAAFKDTWTLSDLDVAWMGLIAEEEPAIAVLLDTVGQVHSEGMQSYLTMMAVRLLEMRRVLKETGSLYLHCDPTASHYLKALLDAVFGRAQFRNEIIWSYRRWPSKHPNFQRMHDVILRYVRGSAGTWNQLWEPASASFLRRFGGKANVLERGATKKRAAAHDTPGMPLRDVWDISIIAGSSKERVGYPTQKPLDLLRRIIEASSNPGDVILDPFCGCATACVAAENLERKWVGIDISPKAVDLVQERLREAPPLGIGSLFHYGFVTSRTDVPQRTDIDAPKNYRQNKHVLYGQQEGYCNGCQMHFQFKTLTVDHVVPQSKGGGDNLDNLQLLCGHCNSIKGNRPQEYLIARLAELQAVGG